MRKFISIILFVSATACSAFAQQTFPVNLDIGNKYNNAVMQPLYLHKLIKDTLAFSKKPLYIFKISSNDKTYNAVPLLKLIDPQDIASMEILKDKLATDQYGTKAKNGVIIITLIQGTEILPANKLLDKYNIDKQFRKLPLYIDSTLTQRSDNLFYTSNKIKTITVAEEKETGMKYISIITSDK
jgi:TonB-dependent SusC/RagA subfamily outer membrane receptor